MVKLKIIYGNIPVPPRKAVNKRTSMKHRFVCGWRSSTHDRWTFYWHNRAFAVCHQAGNTWHGYVQLKLVASGNFYGVMMATERFALRLIVNEEPFPSKLTPESS